MLSKRNKTSSEHIYYGFICTFLAYRLEILPRHCPFYILSIEVTLQFGIGFKGINLERFQQEEQKYQNTSLMRH